MVQSSPGPGIPRVSTSVILPRTVFRLALESSLNRPSERLATLLLVGLRCFGMPCRAFSMLSPISHTSRFILCECVNQIEVALTAEKHGEHDLRTCILAVWLQSGYAT